MHDDLIAVAALLVLVVFPVAWLAVTDYRQRMQAAGHCKRKKHAPPHDAQRSASGIKAEATQPAAVPAQPAPPKPPKVSPETVEALHRQADAERHVAEALERKARYTPDPVKSARIEKQAALAWVRFNKILDQIEKYTA